MTTSEDVSNLFRKFGGNAEQYQELSREGQAEESKARWPLLASLRLAEHAAAPSVRDGRLPVVGAPVPNLRGSEKTVGMSPFAPVPEVTRETLHEAVQDAPPGQAAAAGGMGRTFFRKAATPRPPSSRGVVRTALRRAAEPSSGGAHGLSFLRAGSPPSSDARAAASPRATVDPRHAASPSAAVQSGLHRSSAAAMRDEAADGARALARLAGAGSAASVASASAAASGAAAATVPVAAPGASGAAAGIAQAPAWRADAPGGSAAPAGARPLSAVFSRLVAEQPAPRGTAGPQKTSLFARLSRL
ncbi:MAG: cellulose biosynthesis protein BcsP [Janthinobacterium lividum]